MISSRITTLLITVLIVYIQSCTPALQPLQRKLSGAAPAPENLLDRLEKRLSSVQTVVANAHIKITNTSGKISSKQVIILKKPSALRLDGLTPFGRPAMSITTDGKNISIYNFSKNSLFSGKTDDNEVSRLFPASIEFNYLMDILAGGVPLIDFNKEEMTADIKDELYRLNLKGEKFKEAIYFDPKMLVPKKAAVFDADEKIRLSIIFNDYKDIDGFMMPSSISAELPEEHYKIEISYSKMLLNSEIANNLFVLPPVK